MKTLMRLGAVLVAVALCAPALACSDMMMQQTTAQTTEQQQPAVAKSQTPQTKQTTKKTAKTQKTAKKQSAKVAAN